MVADTGLEPVASALSRLRSSQDELIRHVNGWYPVEESNLSSQFVGLEPETDRLTGRIWRERGDSNSCLTDRQSVALATKLRSQNC